MDDQEHYPAADIASLVGSSIAAYFATLFNKIAGVTPANYRKAHRNNH